MVLETDWFVLREINSHFTTFIRSMISCVTVDNGASSAYLLMPILWNRINGMKLLESVTYAAAAVTVIAIDLLLFICSKEHMVKIRAHNSMSALCTVQQSSQSQELTLMMNGTFTLKQKT